MLLPNCYTLILRTLATWPDTNGSRWQMCPTEDAQIHRLLVFFPNFSSKSKRCFVPRANFRRTTSTIFLICLPKGEISKIVRTPQIQQGCQLKRSVFNDFQDLLGVSSYFWDIHTWCYVAGSCLLGIMFAVSWQVLNDDVVLAERGIQHGDQLLCLVRLVGLTG